MMSAVIAQKLGMTHLYDEANRHLTVSILRVSPQVVTGLRTREKDGYVAVQIGAVLKKRVAKPQKSELKKQTIDLPVSHRREIRDPSDGNQDSSITIGQILTANQFAPGDVVSVTGKSKGKGFAGGIKRHGWSRGPMAHGSKHHRAPGSIGSGYPQRVVPGKKLPGHLGHITVTTKGHKVVAINENDNTIAITGPIPGANRSHVLIQKIV